MTTISEGKRYRDRGGDEQKENERLQTYAKELTRALTDYVGGGSELFNRPIGEFYPADIEFCFRRLRDRDERARERELALRRKVRAFELADASMALRARAKTVAEG